MGIWFWVLCAVLYFVMAGISLGFANAKDYITHDEEAVVSFFLWPVGLPYYLTMYLLRERK